MFDLDEYREIICSMYTDRKMTVGEISKELKRYVESTNRKIIFIWEHEIRDDWFWIGDYLIAGGGEL